MLLQTVSNPLAVLGTLLFYALFLSVTAHLAARNVLGDVDPSVALTVGPVPAAVAVIGYQVGTRFGVPVVTFLPLAILADGVLIRWAYDQPTRRAAYITVIHFVITVLISLVLGGVLLLLSTRPA